ncbi:hypothetical protein SSP24_48600 [Streptomyces spinoverrucosus]|uniref:Uncharacterized protein n=1 Tax=Streptomyces spinoverrucosus TaxID=284043 RepID=A0A4Y3VM34_9ACTN|nr:hypothetical protein [Streptomyces spinoverrucosus]GEC07205.1 hypothetical protein SSP24_48600 [Streptomyces spinoverrucosus]GHB90458.1 hypothetical protein GCM10010397_73270 [Streptomyces spinoverrucosus]
MADMFAVDLALDLSPALPGAVLDTLRWHLGLGGTEPVDASPDPFPLLADRGPAAKIGGVLTGELHQAAEHWSLTARQEIHAELLSDLEPLLEMLAAHARWDGVIGQVRFYEEDVPELLVGREGRLVRVGLRVA